MFYYERMIYDQNIIGAIIGLCDTVYVSMHDKDYP